MPAERLRRVGVLTVSDSRSRKTRSDETTPIVQAALERAGFTVAKTALAPDEVHEIEARIIEMADRDELPLIITTGGTGLGPRDVTPEATQSVIDRAVPGIAEALRGVTAERNPHAWLSRGIAGLRSGALIVNLPGSPRGVKECLDVLLPLLEHALEVIEGHGHG